MLYRGPFSGLPLILRGILPPYVRIFYTQLVVNMKFYSYRCDVINMFGKNLRAIRSKRELTQGEVASLAQIHRRYYQDLEACLKTPSVVIAARLRKALGCEWEELVRGITEDSSKPTR